MFYSRREMGAAKRTTTDSYYSFRYLFDRISNGEVAHKEEYNLRQVAFVADRQLEIQGGPQILWSAQQKRR